MAISEHAHRMQLLSKAHVTSRYREPRCGSLSRLHRRWISFLYRQAGAKGDGETGSPGSNQIQGISNQQIQQKGEYENI